MFGKMEGSVLTEEMIAELKSPLPAEALYQQNNLTMIKPIYVIERLNTVFGIGGWQTQTCPIDKEGQSVVCKTTLSVSAYNIYHESYGSCSNKDIGFAYKGAETDAINKIGSFLGIGMDVYKGKVVKGEDGECTSISENSRCRKTNEGNKCNLTLKSHVNKGGENYIVLEEIDELKNEQELMFFYNNIIKTCNNNERRQWAIKRLKKRASTLSIQVSFE